jgi:hypothetical protein
VNPLHFLFQRTSVGTSFSMCAASVCESIFLWLLDRRMGLPDGSYSSYPVSSSWPWESLGNTCRGSPTRYAILATFFVRSRLGHDETAITAHHSGVPHVSLHHERSPLVEQK